MSDDRWPLWAAEQAGTNRLPSVGRAFIVFAILTVVLLALRGGPQAYAEHVEQANRGKPSTLCAEHQGRPGWDAVCAPRSVPVKAKR
jgi:hypothetical protein